MKKLLFVILCAGMILSCNNDEGETAYISYGDIQIEGDNVKILRDDGAFLSIEQSSVPLTSLPDGQRVVVIYNILSEAVPEIWPTTYPIRLNALNTVLCKTPVEASFIDANFDHRNDSIGNDRVGVRNAWFGGDYLNLNLLFLESNTQGKHFINLVHEDPRPDNDTVYLTLRHNGYDPQFQSNYFARVSFDLSGLIPEGENSIDVSLTWPSYGGTKTDTGTFTRFNTLTGTLSREVSMTGEIPIRIE